ncbi:MAG: hypothetical protein Q4G03_05065 [Planctomycetia bacterium]|nr:hypothetical protein [Planctomycetia bacterium]
MLLSVSNCPDCTELQTVILDEQSSTSASIIDVSAVLASSEDEGIAVSVANTHDVDSPIDQATRDAFDLMWEHMGVCSAEIDADEEAEWLDNSSFEVTPLSLGETLDNSEADGDLNPVAMTSSGGDSSGGSGGNTSGGSGGSSSGGSGGSSSGGSGGSSSGGTGDSGGSGGNVIYTTLSGGVSFVEGATVYLWTAGACPGDVVTITLSGAASSTDDIDYAQSVLQCTVDSSGQAMFVIRTINDGLNENNESLTIHFNVTSSSNSVIDPNGASYTITLYDKPEFVSDILDNTQKDFYRSYVKDVAPVETKIKLRTKIEAPSADVRYQFADDFAYASYFQIDSESGKISLVKSAETILIESGETYAFSFDILAYNANMPDSIDNYCYDVATVQVTISHWSIVRNNQDTASATPSDGCSLESLATTVGLDVDEYRQWLTIASGSENAQIELFDGTMTTVSALEFDDILAANNAAIFSVPNTMFMAYCFNPVVRISGFGFDKNYDALNSLGFKTIAFYNTNYKFDEGMKAKHDFISKIQELSSNKYLHGMYYVCHGVIPDENSNNAIGILAGSEDPSETSWGPRWRINYRNDSSSGSDNASDDDSQWSIAQALSYHLGAVVAQSCFAGSNAQSLCSDNGMFSGQAGEVTVAYWEIEENWHKGRWALLNHLGGFQGTK